MNKDLISTIKLALEGKPSAKFDAESVNKAAIDGILKEYNIDVNDPYSIQHNTGAAFAIIEQVIDEILPKKLEDVFGSYAEVRQFARDAEPIFDIQKIGKNRAKLTLSRGARAGVHRAARLDSKYFSVSTTIVTVGLFLELEDILLGRYTFAELYNNIVEGYQEVIMKEVFNALATGAPLAGYGRIGAGKGSDTAATNFVTTKAGLMSALDEVLPVVKQYGVPTIFGSYEALSQIYNPLANPASAAGYPNQADSEDIRRFGFVQIYKGNRVVELPNYLIDNSNEDWFYDPSYVFVLPSGVKPVKIALKGNLYIREDEDKTGSVEWNAHKLVGVGVVMANNYAVIKLSD